jgi:hypothetical protein
MCANHSSSDVQKSKPMHDFEFRGKWLVNYDPKEYDYPEILVILLKIQDFYYENHIKFNSINIIFNKKDIKNNYYFDNNDILLNLCRINAELEEIKKKPCEPAKLQPLEKPIKTISLLFPRLESDPRWKTMGIPASQLFLASNLQARGFEATPLPLVLPGENPPSKALKADMAGFSLFEDLLPVLRPFLAHFRVVFDGILAAGGAFLTLAPLAAIYHLPQINLFVRGEAELVLPEILEALNRGDTAKLFSYHGLYWQQPGLVVMSDLDRVNRPENFGGFQVNFDFLQPEHIEQGLEMNFSRGCKRGCVFCCRAQGSKLRTLSMEKVEELLKAYKSKVENLIEALESPRPLTYPHPLARGSDQTRSEAGKIKGLMNQTPTKSDYSSNPPFFTININDDDILQDPEYAQDIFALLKKLDFCIFGIQTSTASLVNGKGDPDLKVLDLVTDPKLYIDKSPLLWLGTDTFLPARAKRLGKKLPSREKFTKLLGEMEKRGLRHFHYWISSDGYSTWEEFVEEFSLIVRYFSEFPNFGLLAHAPFVVPYPASRMFRHLAASDSRLKLKLDLSAPDPRFSYKVVDRLETKWPQLNNLLRDEKAGGDKGFFDFLKEKNLIASAQLAYHFLKQEQFQSTICDPNVQRARESLEQLITKLLKV